MGRLFFYLKKGTKISFIRICLLRRIFRNYYKGSCLDESILIDLDTTAEDIGVFN